MEYILLITRNSMAITFMAIGIFIIVATLIGFVWLRVSDLTRMYKRRKVFIEITPPRELSLSPRATEQFFTIFYNLGITKRFRHKILRQNKVSSLEVISTKQNGIRFVIGVNESDANSVERSIAVFMKDAKLKRISDPLLAPNSHTKVKEFKQAKHFAFSLRTAERFDYYDPITYILNAMDKLSDGEQIAMQIVLSSANIRNMAAMVERYREFYKVSESTHNKAYSHLHRADLRVRVVAGDESTLRERVTGLESAITSFSVPKVQMLKARYNFPQALRGRFSEWVFSNRMPSLISRNSAILSSLELANIYHFPSLQNAADNQEVTVSPTLAPPLSIVNNKDYDIVVGMNEHRGNSTPIGLTTAEREKHVFITGGTGNGKTTLLKYGIVQDIKDNKSLAVIDPHGDMAESLLRYIPEERIKDVIYFNPDDLTYPIGLNLLELTPGLDEEDSLREKELVTESVVSVFRKIFSEDDSGGHRIEYVLRNAIHTALTVENTTLFTVYDLLNNPSYRKKVVADLENDDLKNFWRNEIGKAGGMQQVKMVAGITAKIGRFLFSASAKRIFEQPKSTINFDEILDGKILICNFSKGLIGEDTSQLFGIATLAKLQLAALRRARMPEEARKPFYLYVDEFQNFATPSFIQMLSEGRKYKLYLIMAEQSTSQQHDSKMIDVILANVGTVITFRSGNPSDERLLLPLFRPYLKEGDVANLPSRHFYMRISAVNTQKPFSGETLLIEDGENKEIAQKVISSSQKSYATEYKVPEKEAATHTKKETTKKPKSESKKSPGIPTKDGLKNHSRSEGKVPSNTTVKPKHTNNKQRNNKS